MVASDLSSAAPDDSSVAPDDSAVAPDDTLPGLDDLAGPPPDTASPADAAPDVAPPCSCGTRQCGPDGCGGRCGFCAEGTVCDDGLCRSYPLGPGADLVQLSIPPGIARRVAAAGGVALLGTTTALIVFDISDPTRPRELVRVARHVPIEDIAMGDGVAWLSTESGLEVLDVSDPSDPRVVGTALAGRACDNLDLDGTFLLAACGAAVLLDVSEPFAPTPVAEVPHLGYGRVALDSGRIYVRGDEGIEIWEASAAPRRLGVALVDTSRVYHAEASGASLFAYGEGVWHFDVSDPSAPVVTGSDASFTEVMLGVGSEFLAIGRYEGVHGLIPTMSLRTFLRAWGFSIGEFAQWWGGDDLASDGTTGLAAYAGDLLTFPSTCYTNCLPMTLYPTGTGGRLLVPGDGWFSVQSAMPGFATFDVSGRFATGASPRRPIPFAQYLRPELDLFLVGAATDGLLVVLSTKDLLTYSRDDLQALRPLGSYRFPGYVRYTDDHLLAADGALAVARVAFELFVFDLTDPVAPVPVAQAPWPEVWFHSFVPGATAGVFYGFRSEGLFAIDASRLLRGGGWAIRQVLAGEKVSSAVTFGDDLYAVHEDAAGVRTLSVLDASDPSNTVEVARYRADAVGQIHAVAPPWVYASDSREADRVVVQSFEMRPGDELRLAAEVVRDPPMYGGVDSMTIVGSYLVELTWNGGPVVYGSAPPDAAP